MKLYELNKKLEDSELILKEMSNPEIRKVINAGPVHQLVINLGLQDTFNGNIDKATEQEKLKMKYDIFVYESPDYVLYFHYRRMHPIKLCVYKIVEIPGSGINEYTAYSNLTHI